MAVSFEELEGSPVIEFDHGQFFGRRRFLVDYLEWGNFLAELYGGYRRTGDSIQFVAPAAFPGAVGAVPTRVRVEGFPADKPSGASQVLGGPANTYLKALIVVEYEIPFYTGGSARQDLPGVPVGTHLTFSADVGAEYISLPGRQWRWANDNEVISDDSSVTILVPTEEIQLSWYRVPLPPWDPLRDLRGSVNDAFFLGHDIGTVLFVGYQTTHDFQVGEIGLWRLDYQFRVREVISTVGGGTRLGWNFSYRGKAVAGEHWLGIVDEDGNDRYPKRDFSSLFAFGT